MILPFSISRLLNKHLQLFLKPLKLLRKPSTSLSNLLDNTSQYTPSQDTTGSLFVPHHRNNLRDLPSRRLSTDTSTLNLSTLSSNSTLRILRQHAQSLSSEKILLTLYLVYILHLILKPLLYFPQTLRVHFFPEIFSQKL